MRIAFLSWESLYSIAVGGIANHVSELAAALTRKGHEVHVFTRMGNGQRAYQWIDGVHYHRCPFDLNPNFIDEINNMCRSFIYHLWQTEDYIGGFDLIHAHDWLTTKALVWAKDGRGKKGIFTLHSTEYGRCGNDNWGGRSSTIRDYEWEGTYRADRVIAVSEMLGREIMGLYQTPEWKLRVIHNGVDVNQ
jgi:glycogen synthase